MSETTFNCPACGGPNQPATGQARMACTYCGANLTIPEALRTRAAPQLAAKIPAPPKRIEMPEIDASDVLRQAQPLAVRAWNLYAYWTWLRWLFPACLTFFIIGLVLCFALGLTPLILSLLR